VESEIRENSSIGEAAPKRRGPLRWLGDVNRNQNLVAFIRGARRVLPGDPHFGDPLSTDGEGAPRAAARVADRILPDREAASREVRLAGLQVWQALSERLSREPFHLDSTIVFTDLVGFSDWSLEAGDKATLKLLRRVSDAIEPPMLDRGGHIVKRMGDGVMAVFQTPEIAIDAVLAANEALKDISVQGYLPKMRVGIHSGRPSKIGSDWLGIDVNIAARVMERAKKGGIMASGPTLDRLPLGRLGELGITIKRMRNPAFTGRIRGVPPGLTMYQLNPAAEPHGDDGHDGA
jgi:class 3 adenylate cyclase